MKTTPISPSDRSSAARTLSLANVFDDWTMRYMSSSGRVKSPLGLARELLERFGMDGVVPVAVELVPGERDGGELFVADLDTGWVVTLVERRVDLESLLGGGVGDQLHHHSVRREGTATPVHGDKAEEAMFDLVPLRCPRREVGHSDLETCLLGQLGQFYLPGPDAVTVGATCIGADEELRGLGVAGSPHLGPPASDGGHGKAGGVGVVTD